MSRRGLPSVLFCAAAALCACDTTTTPSSDEVPGARDNLPPRSAAAAGLPANSLWSALPHRDIPQGALPFEGLDRAPEDPPVEAGAETTPMAIDIPLVAPTVSAIKVTEIGAEPRQSLKFVRTVGASSSFELTLAMDATMAVDGNQVAPPGIPPMRFSATERAVSTDGGQLKSELTLQSFDIAEEGQDEAMMRMTMAAMVGIDRHTLSETRDVHGKTSSSSLHVPAGVSPQAIETFRGFLDAIQRTRVVLPKAPVGIGARWTVEQTTEDSGMMINQTAVYTLVDRRDDLLVLSLEVTGEPAVRTLRPEGAPAGLELNIEELSADAHGTLEIDLNHLTVRKASLAARFAVQMDVKQAGRPTQKMQSAMNTRLELSSKP